jgi:hypothetical protein
MKKIAKRLYDDKRGPETSEDKAFFDDFMNEIQKTYQLKMKLITNRYHSIMNRNMKNCGKSLYQEILTNAKVSHGVLSNLDDHLVERTLLGDVATPTSVFLSPAVRGVTASDDPLQSIISWGKECRGQQIMRRATINAEGREAIMRAVPSENDQVFDGGNSDDDSSSFNSNIDLEEGNEATINCLGKPGSDEFWIELSRSIAQRGYNLKNKTLKFESRLTQQLNNPLDGGVVPWWEMGIKAFSTFIRKNFGFVINRDLWQRNDKAAIGIALAEAYGILVVYEMTENRRNSGWGPDGAQRLVDFEDESEMSEQGSDIDEQEIEHEYESSEDEDSWSEHEEDEESLDSIDEEEVTVQITEHSHDENANVVLQRRYLGNEFDKENEEDDDSDSTATNLSTLESYGDNGKESEDDIIKSTMKPRLDPFSDDSSLD